MSCKVQEYTMQTEKTTLANFYLPTVVGNKIVFLMPLHMQGSLVFLQG